ncbi:hypothetical protein NSX24_22950 [Salmonella enterica]|nr:hypothetical protein [Salmonella enterica]ARB10869.1 EaD protein [Salmonella phage 29485]ELX25742.1 Eaa protein [Salmonella enterica subsp. enterica serovar Rissen str. 150]MCH5788208.1 hypothetical protein [Salmonella enterica]MCR2129697.1 hypothetical protein [Salmonella enterica]MCR2273549.1 hypothetical protein [Salmonella enterica]
MTITKERLLKIQHWRETYGADSNVMLPAEEAEELARIALAALEAEKGADPVVFTDERNLRHIARGRETSLIWGKQNQEVGDIPLYRHAQPVPVDKEFIPKNLDKALGVVGVALPESKEEFNFQIERWIQRLIDRVIRYADEFKEQPAPVVPDEMATSDDMNLYQKSFAQGYNACRNAMLNAEPLRAIQTAPALDFLNKNAAPLHATPKGNRLRIAEGEFAAYFPQERPVSGARVIAWDESGHLLGIGFGRDTRGSGIAIVVEGKKYDSNHIIHWCNYPAIPEGLNIRAIAALRAAVRNQWLKSDNFADKVYWKSMHSIANEIVEAMMKNEPHQPTENHIPSREAIIAGGVLVQCPRCYNDSYRLNVNGLTHYWCDKCANSITSESK